MSNYQQEQRAKRLFRDYYNNYLTVAAFAAGNHLSISQAEQVITLGREVHNREAQFLKGCRDE